MVQQIDEKEDSDSSTDSEDSIVTAIGDRAQKWEETSVQLEKKVHELGNKWEECDLGQLRERFSELLRQTEDTVKCFKTCPFPQKGDICCFCHQTDGLLMLCDAEIDGELLGCGQAWHAECLKWKEDPNGNWLCQNCALDFGIKRCPKKGYAFQKKGT